MAQQAADRLTPPEHLHEVVSAIRAGIGQVIVGKVLELVYRVPCDDGRHALVFCDCLFNHDDMPGIIGWFFKRVTRSTGHFGITGLGRFLMLKDGAAFAEFLRSAADERSLAAISVAHGEALVDEPAKRLLEAADRV